MKVSEHLEKIDVIAEELILEKKKKEIFRTSGESAEELYIRAAGVAEAKEEEQ